MIVEFKRTLRKYSGQILGWGIGLAAYILLMASIYSDITAIDFAAFLEYYPEGNTGILRQQPVCDFQPGRLSGYLLL